MVFTFVVIIAHKIAHVSVGHGELFKKTTEAAKIPQNSQHRSSSSSKGEMLVVICSMY